MLRTQLRKEPVENRRARAAPTVPRQIAQTGFPGLRAMTTPLKVTQYVPPPIEDQSSYKAECDLRAT